MGFIAKMEWSGQFNFDPEGQAVPIQQHYRKAQAKLVRVQRQLAQKIEGSANYQKLANRSVRVCHIKISQAIA